MIEHDIKLIYAFMLEGNVDNNYEEIEISTLGNMINKLRELDYSDDKPYISLEDYKYLGQICKKRNYWAHKVFTEFLYIEGWENKKEYKVQCEKLKKDRNKVERAAKILENVRVDYCTSHER